MAGPASQWLHDRQCAETHRQRQFLEIRLTALAPLGALMDSAPWLRSIEALARVAGAGAATATFEDIDAPWVRQWKRMRGRDPTEE